MALRASGMIAVTRSSDNPIFSLSLLKFSKSYKAINQHPLRVVLAIMLHLPRLDALRIQNALQNHHLEVLFLFLQGNLNLHHQYLHLPPVQPGATML
jgi:hypothetical protein